MPNSCVFIERCARHPGESRDPVLINNNFTKCRLNIVANAKIVYLRTGSRVVARDDERAHGMTDTARYDGTHNNRHPDENRDPVL